MNPGPQVWIVIARPDRLPAALLTAEILGDLFPGGCRLIRERSEWWDRIPSELYVAHFASIHDFDRIEKCRGLRDLPRLYRAYAHRQRALKELPVTADTDAFVVLGGTLSIANAAISAHPTARKILVSGRHAYDEITREIDRYRYRFTTSSWFENRVVERLTGVERTLNLKPRKNPGGDGVRISRLERNAAEIYDAIVIVSQSGTELPRQRSPQMVTSLHPRIADLQRAEEPVPAGTRRVIFFGTPFLLIHNLEPTVYVEHLDRCLDYLREHYGAACRLIYRPHPVETDEVNRLQLDGFEIENDRAAAEVYMLQYYPEIEAVFSVSSTVSRSALNNGLNGYSLWRVFPFPATAAQFFERLMGDVPIEFDIRDLSQRPLHYVQRQHADTAENAFPLVLRRAVTR